MTWGIMGRIVEEITAAYFTTAWKNKKTEKNLPNTSKTR
jgi:hypothetical protein